MRDKARAGVVAGVVALGVLSAGTAVAAPTGETDSAAPRARAAVAGADNADGASQPAAAETAPSADGLLAVHRKSSKCNSPKGKRFNVSWGDGSQSTTFYFNNHCNKKRRIVVRLNWGNRPVVECIVVNPHTKGRKKIGRQTDALKISLPKSKCP
ncbi:hypothetical protein [Streptomyces boncukensis]|uniref:Uncharacterized protein n=1 Tax=Streptomyces boncukensis TaxID=2711219 RepID=A0A6G4WWB0_9ACTN|nr:hypothetical protein [Streptomyces boncukensis]NGO69398.1 hypothetical protein [Streptomyces boncukensis]